MITITQFRQYALAYPDTAEVPHFDKTSFRVGGKIFATADAARNRATLMLSPEDQDVFCAFDRAAMYPVPNSWGRKGATYAELERVRADLLQDALSCAYRRIRSAGKPASTDLPSDPF
jgi:hypothetical protein